MYTFKKENGELVPYINGENVVSVDAQSFTEAQKTQARENINAGNADVVAANTELLNVTMNDYDVSKGTIEERLTRLGFKEGSIESRSGLNATENKLTRQGNYVIGKLVIPYSIAKPSTSAAIGTVPTDFLPKETVYLHGLNGDVATNHFMGWYEINTDGELHLTHSSEAGFGEIGDVTLYFGYEALPIPKEQ